MTAAYIPIAYAHQPACLPVKQTVIGTQIQVCLVKQHRYRNTAQLLVGAVAAQRFIDWVESEACGLDLLSQANYRLPVNRLSAPDVPPEAHPDAPPG